MKFHMNRECYNINDINLIDLETRKELIMGLLDTNEMFENLAILLETNMIESFDENNTKMNSAIEAARLRLYIIDNAETIKGLM